MCIDLCEGCENLASPFSPRCDLKISGVENIRGMNTRMRRGKSRMITQITHDYP
jgi:hypothetical protein